MLEVDPQGFDILDRKLLATIIERFDGGPVGIDSLAAAISEERGTLEDVIEPFLIQQGFLMRTARGRMVTRAAYVHFGLKAAGIERDLNLPLFGDSHRRCRRRRTSPTGPLGITACILGGYRCGRGRLLRELPEIPGARPHANGCGRSASTSRGSGPSGGCSSWWSALRWTSCVPRMLR